MNIIFHQIYQQVKVKYVHEAKNLLSKSIIKVDTGDIDLYDEETRPQGETEMTNDMTEVCSNNIILLIISIIICF